MPLDDDARALLSDALGPADVVERYLAALGRARLGSTSPATLAPDVERIGPYRDVVQGRDAYVDFLRTTIAALSGYDLESSAYWQPARP